MAGPEEFMEGLALGTHQFVEGTIGMQQCIVKSA